MSYQFHSFKLKLKLRKTGLVSYRILRVRCLFKGLTFPYPIEEKGDYFPNNNTLHQAILDNKLDELETALTKLTEKDLMSA